MFCFALNSSKLWWDNPPWDVTTVDFFVAVPAQSTCFQPAKKYNFEISRNVPKPLSCLRLCTWMSVQYSFALSETINFFNWNWKLMVPSEKGSPYIYIYIYIYIKNSSSEYTHWNAGNVSPPPRVSDPDMHQGMCVVHVLWCMPGSLTSGFLWSRWRGKRSRHSRHMRNPQFYVSGNKPMAACFRFIQFAVICKHGLEEVAQFVVNNFKHVKYVFDFQHFQIFEQRICMSIVLDVRHNSQGTFLQSEYFFPFKV